MALWQLRRLAHGRRDVTTALQACRLSSRYGCFVSYYTVSTTARCVPTPGLLSQASHGAVSVTTVRPRGGSSALADQPHVPVMLREVLDAFQSIALNVYLDCTLGAGGHAMELVSAHPEMRMLLGIDQDPVAHSAAEPRISAAAAGRNPDFFVRLLRGNYRDLKPLLATVSTPPPRPNGILMDLGISSMQVDTAERGFSFLRDGPLDMRMDPTAALSAEEVLNTWSEVELGRIIRDYGEEKLWKVVARRLVQAREVEPIRTTAQLVKAVGQTRISGKGAWAGKGARKGIHPATRTFQALRIAVNDELRKLEEALPDAIDTLAPGGRLAVISFHSLEDRIVKHAFLRATGRPTPDEEILLHGPSNFAFYDVLDSRKVADLVTRKPVVPEAEETEANARARSAKLRVLQKLQSKP